MVDEVEETENHALEAEFTTQSLPSDEIQGSDEE